ncbi:gluconate 2-dehydrogenase subunit 3 family protein [Paenibacillus thiaminolyticus]|uniref:Gluconate 2-dehydrogenase subunit 3 family protein n=1 Tax=Paenibacillus thiaminolyticus TaxID=49283 RepID=A0AAP9DQI1_PANTH|nr:gluconate 2-dehydrogenase subunit 3 family protein [Paenibacillus thiaminolyticus]MCY9536740.1 gluconate 2-dehydrogenase subunit 3 family protein [Paenibacillus thiaminolyticus]MCY9600539.1 gluconate 2-dehydrogenase subunit 3 family protein [Paenibacillus thiaminolyticus]MCY9606580.1 gluconate 2-dehydrogenase subunit 3 family protein [Paenibacillus thiaminolyticus]MCY9614855.1 gluconate 2-dehydrogenase subunit 3 family protein [Paenibacillus thiaminolyticus]MCY9619852.1 gluconate 2-dehydrog
MAQHSHYPSFDVMKERHEWDDHTQSIVMSRAKPNNVLHFLTPPEAGMIRRIGSLLVGDETPEALDFVLVHIDRTLHQSPGESQRKTGVTEAPKLLRAGLHALEQAAQALHSSSFMDLNAAEQKQYLQDMSQSAAKPIGIWNGIPQAELFRKLLNLTVEAYCSHPKVWSDIGYAGPAYPRGYVRTQMGQLDPWEAQPEQ